MGAMELTLQQEKFAVGCATLTSQSAAYRQAYNVGEHTKWNTVAEEASKLAALPHVAARIRELRQQAAERNAIPDLAERIREQRELERADPTEIIGIRWGACRHCHGVDHRYQWTDDAEYATACDLAVKARDAMPDMSGGFDYNPTRGPVNECPRCWGVGIQRPYVVDTTKLSGPAKRLYKGIKIKGNGDIEVLLHDQQKATDMLNRIQGAYKDGVPATQPIPSEAIEAAASAKTQEDRTRAYLRLVAS